MKLNYQNDDVPVEVKNITSQLFTCLRNHLLQSLRVIWEIASLIFKMISNIRVGNSFLIPIECRFHSFYPSLLYIHFPIHIHIFIAQVYCSRHYLPCHATWRMTGSCGSRVWQYQESLRTRLAMIDMSFVTTGSVHTAHHLHISRLVRTCPTHLLYPSS